MIIILLKRNLGIIKSIISKVYVFVHPASVKPEPGLKEIQEPFTKLVIVLSKKEPLILLSESLYYELKELFIKV